MSPAPSRPLVLIVEDEDNIAMALEYVLTREGFRHDRLAKGGSAVGRIIETHPDIVLLDVMLPEMSGYDICALVRANPALADIKIIMMTARGSALERKRSLEMGADSFIAKPFELAALRDELNRMVTKA
ncbi:response regulator [Rhodobacter ferrooxidans]|uniref:Response regulator receiver protein n=1 Tax=Rhodobacter ferrooxidans TaxID=371731 RepID=C8RYU8_9RHOB|nr:response regulator [Rhodobacter sp. SW2]EEW26286.1 response regulator receiver protein [Rhodobacter sp. SW2]